MSLIIGIIGASGIIAQIILIRELLVNFQGNELSIGLILGNWLITEALGSYLFRRIKITLGYYKTLIYLFAVILPALIVLTRIIRPIMRVLPGEIITIPEMYISSLLILLPVGFLHGALFTSSVSLLEQNQSLTNIKIPGFVYVIENLGTIIGGVIISFLLIPYFNSLRIALLLGIVNLFTVLLLSRFKYLLIRLTTYLVIIIFGFLFVIAPHIEHWTLKNSFPGFNIISSENTVYSNITVINREEQYMFLLDGTPTITIPYPDQNFIEDFVNFPLLRHPNPRKVLLISGGAGGIINQMLQYKLSQIYYLELDPNLIQTIRKFPISLTNQELSNPRVKIISSDARLFLEKDTTHFDIIFVSFLTPLSLQINRFFTQEFFSICQDKLKKDGILATISPGSSVYLSPALNNLINSHVKTIKKIFPNVIVIPGDFNLYLSSSNNSTINADTLYNRLRERDIRTTLFSKNYIQYRIHEHLTHSLLTSSQISVKANQDGLPHGLFYNLWYKNTVANPSLKTWFDLTEKLNLKLLLMSILIIFIILLFIRKDKKSTAYISYVIFTTGFTAMVFSLVLSLGFQIRYGYLYYQISILLTTFISGNVLGGYISNQVVRVNRRILIVNEIIIMLFSLIVILLLHDNAYPKLFNSPTEFFILLFIAGLLVGFEFPIASRICNTNNSQITPIVGKLYSADLLGGYVGAITIPIIMLPIIGIYETLLFTIFLKLTSTILVLTLK